MATFAVLRDRIKQTLENEDARYVYADTITNAFIAAQIKALREARELSQDELASMIGTKQSGISRLERNDYSSWKVETLRKLARAFGVRLRVRFEGFNTLLDEVSGFNEKNLAPATFQNDPVFGSSIKRRVRRNKASSRRVSNPQLKRKKPQSASLETGQAQLFSTGSGVEVGSGNNPAGATGREFIGGNSSTGFERNPIWQTNRL